MYRLIVVLAASTALAGCVTRPADVPSPPVEESAPPAAEAPPAPKPEYGSYGFDAAGMNTNIKAGDDFFGYASGTWDQTTQIPSDKARYGMFNVLDDLSKTRTREIIEGQARDPNSKIGAAYNSFMN